MTATAEEPLTGVCANHPRRETALRCGKCDDFICTKCMISTPVGVRCARCAQLRRLPQYEVGPLFLLRSAVSGMVVSVIAWYFVSYAVFLRFFLSVLVGVAVGEVMSRMAKRRSNRSLEVLSVLAVVAGLVLTELARPSSSLRLLLAHSAGNISALVFLAVPAIVASYVAIVKLR